MNEMTYPKAREEEVGEKPWPGQHSDYMNHGWKKKKQGGNCHNRGYIEEVRIAYVKQY